MKLSEVRDILNAEVVVGDDQIEKVVDAAGGADLLDDILGALAEGSVLLTGVVSEQVLRIAKLAGVGALIFVRGKKPGKDIVDLAKSYDIPVLLTDYSMFVACGRLYLNGLRGLNGSW